VTRRLGCRLAVALLLATGCRAAAERAELEVLGAVPDFAFTDQTGTKVTAADLRGRVHIASFIFTRCPTVCPTTTLKMQRLGERLRDASGVHLVSISVDPEHDTPPVLTEFASRYRADPSRWKFLTGPPADVRRAVEEGFRIAVERGAALADGTPNIVHGTHFVLFDRQLRIRGYYDSDDAGRLDQLVADAGTLAREP
jgi:protein SCO1